MSARGHALQFRDVTCLLGHGRRRTPALRELSLVCPAGRTTCLAGPNGAGKSTALAAAAGLLPLNRGAVSFGDQEISPVTPPAPMAYLPQHSMFPAALSVQEAFRLHAVTLDSRAEHPLQGSLAPVWNQRVGELSSGWVRRLGLAVALSMATDLVLLDEPFVGLDFDTLERLLAELARLLEQGCTLVVASHDYETLDRLRPRLAVLDGGRLVGLVEQPGASTRARVRELLGGPGQEAAHAQSA